MGARFKCPACGQALTLPDQSTADAVKCPSCAKVIRLRRHAPPGAQPEAPQPATPPPVTASPPPPRSGSAGPSRAAAQRRPAARPKRRSLWPWLAALGAVAALVAITLATGVFSRGAGTTARGPHPPTPTPGLSAGANPKVTTANPSAQSPRTASPATPHSTKVARDFGRVLALLGKIDLRRKDGYWVHQGGDFDFEKALAGQSVIDRWLSASGGALTHLPDIARGLAKVSAGEALYVGNDANVGIAAVRSTLGDEDVVETQTQFSTPTGFCDVKWYRYGWLSLGVYEGKVIYVCADLRKVPSH